MSREEDAPKDRNPAVAQFYSQEKVTKLTPSIPTTTLPMCETSRYTVRVKKSPIPARSTRTSNVQRTKLWNGPAAMMRDRANGLSASRAVEGKETNAAGITTVNDAPADMMGMASLSYASKRYGDHDSGADSQRSRQSVPKFVDDLGEENRQ